MIGGRAAAAGCLLLAACGSTPDTDSRVARDADRTSRTVVPGERFGPIGSRTSEADLVALFGADAVVRDEVYLAEGFCTPGTIVLPDTADRVEITWIDSLRTRPASVSAREAGASWRTEAGVGIGTTLDELERIAARPVSFGGFGWDYGGAMSWSEPYGEGRGLGLQLGPDPEAWNRSRDDPRITELLGEGTVSSDHPLLDEIPVRVEILTIVWGTPYGERFCG